MKIFFFFNILVLFNELINSKYVDPQNNNIGANSFIYGSCFKGTKATYRNDIFKNIEKYNPDVYLWLGDAAYLDKLPIPTFNYTLEEPNYNNFQENYPIVGIWDDHDYGVNDGNKFNNQNRDFYQKLYLDFIEEPKDSVRRKRDRGIYTSYTFGEKNSHRNYKLILLDTRFHKTRLWFNDEADMLGKCCCLITLGEEQWKWLEEELLSSNETFIFIASGQQVLPFNRMATEAWYGNSRKRLFELLERIKVSGVVLLSGDIHSAQFLKTFCTLPGMGYPLYEFTSSGLSHYCPFHCQIFFDFVLPNDYQVFYDILLIHLDDSYYL